MQPNKTGLTSPSGKLGPGTMLIESVLKGAALIWAIAALMSPIGRFPLVRVSLAVKYLHAHQMIEASITTLSSNSITIN